MPQRNMSKSLVGLAVTREKLFVIAKVFVGIEDKII